MQGAFYASGHSRMQFHTDFHLESLDQTQSNLTIDHEPHLQDHFLFRQIQTLLPDFLDGVFNDLVHNPALYHLIGQSVIGGQSREFVLPYLLGFFQLAGINPHLGAKGFQSG